MIATSAYVGDNTSDIFFSAGTNGTNGTNGTVTIAGTQNAHSITFRDPVAITLNEDTALNLSSVMTGAGIFVAANAANTISTPVILNSAVTCLTTAGAQFLSRRYPAAYAHPANLRSTFGAFPTKDPHHPTKIFPILVGSIKSVPLGESI